MAKIVIKESDLTTPIISGESSEIVYVPGFGTNDWNYLDTKTAIGKGVPTLCTTVAEFEAYFGSIPAVLGEDSSQEYLSNFNPVAIPSSGFSPKAGQVDPSYVYAKQLIQSGISVLYERVNDLPNGDVIDEPTVDKMYQILSGVGDYSPIDNLGDVGEYDVKYITSGGYPTFEYGYSLITKVDEAETSTGAALNLEEIDSSKFVASVNGEEGKYQFSCTVQPVQIATATTESQAIQDLAVDSDAFIQQYSEVGSYVFTAVVDGSSVDWTYNSEPADIATLGITYTGTPANDDTITVAVSSSEAKTWSLDGEVVLLSDYGIVITNESIVDDGSIVVVELKQNLATSISGKMLNIAAARGDCIALIDHVNNPERPLGANNVNSVFYSVSDSASPYQIASPGTYGAMFTPWYAAGITVNTRPASLRGYDDNIEWVPNAMPGSFAYLTSLAESVRNNPSWLAIAGVTRGIVPNLFTLSSNSRLTNAIADSYQVDDGIAINPITNIRPYGYTIWGNRTLRNNVGGMKATSFLNIRNMVSDIKKVARTAAISCMFEQNTDILWLNFKSYIEPLLERMTSGYGINQYSIIREESDSPVKLVATIRIYPVYAVEMFEITVELADEVVSVSSSAE